MTRSVDPRSISFRSPEYRSICSRTIAIVILVGAIASAVPGCDPGTETATGVPAAAPSAGGAAPTPQEIEASIAAADDYFNTQEIDKAELVLARLIQRAPREGRAHELMGQVLSIRAATAATGGDVEVARRLRQEAYDHYRIATEVGPASAGLEQSAGTIAMVAGDSASALSHFEAARALDPVNPQYPLYAAQLLIADGAHDDARERLDRVLELDPDEPLAHASLAVIALAEGRTEAALEGIARARALAPLDVRFRVQEARILRRTGRPEQAVETLLALGRTELGNEAVAFELAEGYAAIDRHLDAAGIWMFRFGTAEPSALSYRDATRAGHALLRAGDLAGARHWLREAVVLAPNAPEVRALAVAIDDTE